MGYLKKEKIYDGADFAASAVGMVLKTFGVSDETEYYEDENGIKTVLAGTIYPSDDENAVGIVFKSVDVTNGEKPASVMVGGRVYADRIEISKAAETALKDKGFVFEKAPETSVIYICETGFKVDKACTFSAEDICEASDGSELVITEVKCDEDNEDDESVCTATLKDGVVTIEKNKGGNCTLYCTVTNEKGFTDVVSVDVAI